MTTIAIPHPQIVPQDQRLNERMNLFPHEKELAKQSDQVNAEQ